MVSYFQLLYVLFRNYFFGIILKSRVSSEKRQQRKEQNALNVSDDF